MSDKAQQKAVEAAADSSEDMVDELAPGTKLLRGQYTIIRYLNSGGFGITYLAKDSLDRNVVIKECFPSSFCRRSKTVVAARSRAHTAELRSVVQLFVREARNLAKIVHPNIVAVHQVFEDNFTAYMAIDYIDGLDLQEIIEGKGTMPGPEGIVQITEKLLGAVDFIHAHDMLHRDISPDNVLIDKHGEPILIDFGAARDEASQKNRAMSALRVVKDGYSPQEFYIAGSEQGPWSDLYALGATLYHLITGSAPINGQARLAALAEGRPDPYVALDGRYTGYPPGFLKAIDKAMHTLPSQRVQSAQEWLLMFHSTADLGARTGSVEQAVRAVVEGRDPVAAAPMSMGHTLTPDEERQINSDIPPTGFGSPPDYAAKPAAATLSDPTPPKGGSKAPMLAGIVIALAVVGGGAVMMMGGKDPEPAAVAEVAEPAKPAETAVKEEPAAAATETAAAETAATETAATETAAAEPAKEEPAKEAAAAEPATQPEDPAEAPAETASDAAADSGAGLPAPTGKLLENQIGFAAWDASIPFMEESRIVGEERVAIISRLLPNTDLAKSGTWLAKGLLLHSVNGISVKNSGSFTAAVLNAAKVDPDGKARVVVEYSGSSLERQTGLMTVDMTRLVSLANGVNVKISVTEDDKWQAEVTGVTVPSATTLRQGDILFRDKTSGTAIDGPLALEEVMAALVSAGTSVTEFSVIRSNKLTTAAMQLAVEKQ